MMTEYGGGGDDDVVDYALYAGKWFSLMLFGF